MILGLDQITFAELKSSQQLVHALHQKLQSLDVSRFVDEEVSRKVRTLIDLLRATLADEYQNLSLRAFAHIAVALDYFLVIRENEAGSIHDHQPAGYADDLRKLSEVFHRFGHEISAFLGWKAMHTLQ